MDEKSMAKEMLVQNIKNYVELHRAEELSLDKIAAELNYSKFYMERVFAKITGMTIYKYIQACRMNAAAEQLARTNRPIIDIALEAGYNSPQAFTQAFRRIYLCPPRIYRKNKACRDGVQVLRFSLVFARTGAVYRYRGQSPACRNISGFQEGRWAA